MTSYDKGHRSAKDNSAAPFWDSLHFVEKERMPVGYENSLTFVSADIGSELEVSMDCEHMTSFAAPLFVYELNRETRHL